MRLKKAVVIFGSIMIGLIVLMIYTAKDLTVFPSRKSSVYQDYHDVSIFFLFWFLIFDPISIETILKNIVVALAFKEQHITRFRLSNMCIQKIISQKEHVFCSIKFSG